MILDKILTIPCSNIKGLLSYAINRNYVIIKKIIQAENRKVFKYTTLI